MTAYAAGAGAPAKLGEAKSDAQGAFKLSLGAAPAGSSVYVVARGGTPEARPDRSNNPALALLAILGATPPKSVTINEFTTVASVWTNAQFLEGETLKGHALGLKIAAGNVPSFVDLATGGWGGVIQDPLNGPQTPTMANFATLANLLSACATRLTPDACGRLFAASTPPKGPAPTDTLTVAIAIARNPWYQPQRLFQLLDAFYTVPKGKTMRDVPFMPYLGFSPSAWVAAAEVRRRRIPRGRQGDVRQPGQPLGGRQLHDRLAGPGHPLAGQRVEVRSERQAALADHDRLRRRRHAGRHLRRGRGREGPGLARELRRTIVAVFDKTGKPLTPPQGITFDGKLGLMQGVIVTPGGDVWAVGISKNQLLFFPGGDYTKGKIVCEGRDVEPCKSFLGPFHLGIDQQNRIWVTNGFGGMSPGFRRRIRPSREVQHRLERQRARDRQPGQRLGDEPARQLRPG